MTVTGAVIVLLDIAGRQRLLQLRLAFRVRTKTKRAGEELAEVGPNFRRL
jgi:hypothetical protein